MTPAELQLPSDPTAPRTARRWLRGCFADTSLPVYDTVELLLTEVITNAVVHARSSTVVRLAEHDRQVCLEVEDACPSLPEHRENAAPLAEEVGLQQTGRGMWLLDTLTQDWGWRRLPQGKVVWFCVPAHS